MVCCVKSAFAADDGGVAVGVENRGPFGLAGGDPGAPGSAQITRADGTVEALGGCVQSAVSPGDRLLIATPGGGGWGSPAVEVEKQDA